MIRTFATSILSLSLLAAAPAHARDITGMWNTGSDGGKVEIYKCGSALCGKIVDANRLRQDPDFRDVRNSNRKLRNRKLKGLMVLRNFTGGPTKWSGGPVYDPVSGDGADSGQLELRSDGSLEVKGCVLLFCRTKVWTRARD